MDAFYCIAPLLTETLSVIVVVVILCSSFGSAVILGSADEGVSVSTPRAIGRYLDFGLYFIPFAPRYGTNDALLSQDINDCAENYSYYNYFLLPVTLRSRANL